MKPQYLAGFIDADESMCLAWHKKTKTSSARWRIQLQISQKFKGILEDIKESYGGYLGYMKTNKCWRLTFIDGSAVRLIKVFTHF